MLTATPTGEGISEGVNDVGSQYASRSADRIDALSSLTVTGVMIAGLTNTTLENHELPKELMLVFTLPAVVELKRQASIAIKLDAHGYYSLARIASIA
jgi:hypothetical protein